MFYNIIMISLMILIYHPMNDDLVPLFKIEGSYYDDDEKCLIIPKYNLKKDTDNKLYHKDKLIFSPTGDFDFCIFEIFKEEYIIVSSISDEYKYSPIIYLLAKNKILIISLTDTEKIYEVDIRGYSLKDICIENKSVLVENLENEILEFCISELE